MPDVFFSEEVNRQYAQQPQREDREPYASANLEWTVGSLFDIAFHDLRERRRTKL